ncbi:hypothetical protein SOCEGT47_001440 [Sorangium cellulosum]|uniref:Uncharacterized protein n=1 Tax=Sorangium cellulosum TaxID=56 RepID=A0A4V0NCM5_SORCE|nr:hypothetical protein [Sorangium cellulosum]AUX19692.1 hypothetical protein SOCEGT47_001440 [Sorangium cellulosum]
MPGTSHEVLIVALREQPGLLGALVSTLTGVKLPRSLKPSDATLRFVKPAELRLDLVYRGGQRRWVLVELQRGVDPAKRRRWPLAASLLHDQTGVAGDVLVITARRAVARWAERVACVRTRLGTVLQLKPVVLHLGAAESKALLDERHPELALFAAWAMQHRHGPRARAVVERAFELTERLPPALRRAQQRAILSVLSERMLALLREASMNPDKIPETPAARKLRLFLEAQGRKKGRAEGEAKGRAEGEAKGRAEGEARGRQQALMTLLRARGLSPSQDDEARILACTDAAKLDRWIARAATATSVREALGTRATGARARPRAPRRPRPPASASRS